MAEYDAVLVGSGINSLVAGAMLARDGWNVCVLERNDYLGGGIKTAEITEPGFHHDVFSGWHPLFLGAAAYQALKDDLLSRGLEYLNTDQPTASVFPDGASSFLTTSHEENVAEFDRYARGDGGAWERAVGGFMPNADLSFGVIGTELWSPSGIVLALQAYRRMGSSGLLRFAGESLSTCRDWLSNNFRSREVHGLLAPWVLHTGLGPDAVASGFMTQVISVALQAGGMPVPKGISMKMSSPERRRFEGRSVARHRPRDVDPSAGQSDQSLGVPLTLRSLAVVEGPGLRCAAEAGEGRLPEDPLEDLVAATHPTVVTGSFTGVVGGGDQPGVGGEPIGALKGPQVAGGHQELGSEDRSHSWQANAGKLMRIGASGRAKKRFPGSLSRVWRRPLSSRISSASSATMEAATSSAGRMTFWALAAARALRASASAPLTERFPR